MVSFNVLTKSKLETYFDVFYLLTPLIRLTSHQKTHHMTCFSNNLSMFFKIFKDVNHFLITKTKIFYEATENLKYKKVSKIVRTFSTFLVGNRIQESVSVNWNSPWRWPQVELLRGINSFASVPSRLSTELRKQEKFIFSFFLFPLKQPKLYKKFYKFSSLLLIKFSSFFVFLRGFWFCWNGI